MKKTKVVLAMVCAVLLVAASVMGTLAYLTSTDNVVNTFTVGNVTLGNENEAGLDEAKVNLDGQPLKETTTTDDDGNTTTDKVVEDVKDATRVQENNYKLQPGHTYTKDPTIHVGDNSDDCYLFVKVENGIAAIEDSTNKIADQMTAKGWKALTDYNGIYVYVGKESVETATKPTAVNKGNDVVVFESFKIGDSVNNDTLQDYADEKITVTAFAVQVDGFTDKTSEEIFKTAFVDQKNIAAAIPAPDGVIEVGPEGKTPADGDSTDDE